MDKDLARLMSQFGILFVAVWVLAAAFPKYVPVKPASSTGPAEANALNYDSYQAV